MRRLSDISTSKKIYGLVGLLFLLIAAVSGTLIWILRDTDNRYSDLLARDTRAVVEEMRIRGDLQNYGRQMNNVLLVAEPPGGLDALEQSLKGLAVAIDHSRTIAQQVGGTVSLLAEISEGLPKIEATAAATIAIKRAAAPDHDAQARASWGGPNGRPLVVKLYDDIAQASDRKMANVAALSAGYTSRTDSTTVIAVVVIALGLAVAGGLAFAVATIGITRPLATLRATMRRLADHDLDVEVLGITRQDEIGAMAQAVQVFKENAITARVAQQEQEAARKRHIEDEARAKADAEQAAAALVVGSIGAGLERLAAGDLTYRLDTVLPPAYETLRVNLNDAIVHLHGLVQGILANTSGLRSGTNEITQAADDLSRRTEQQAASLEETAAALDEITSTVRRSASGAQQARNVVVQTKVDAENSGEVVRNAVSAMGKIEQSSRQISQIIGVIDEIAFQTNLLALNAGVEAARAGDAGRGFAVVASEVRTLAQRSAEAAKEIKALISASAEQVGSGVKLVGETGRALEGIVAKVTQINGVVDEIANSAEEQATGLQQVNTAVNQMDQVTQQNAAMVEQTTAAAHSLSSQTEELVQLTARFRVEQDPAGVQSLYQTQVSRKLPASTSSTIPARYIPAA